jgi:hypothetical protein
MTRKDRQIIIDGVIHDVIQKTAGTGLIKVRVPGNQTCKWVDVYLHQVSELDGPGILEALSYFGEATPNGQKETAGEPEFQEWREGPLDF